MTDPVLALGLSAFALLLLALGQLLLMITGENNRVVTGADAGLRPGSLHL